jgi:hypothetical protein
MAFLNIDPMLMPSLSKDGIQFGDHWNSSFDGRRMRSVEQNGWIASLRPQ